MKHPSDQLFSSQVDHVDVKLVVAQDQDGSRCLPLGQTLLVLLGPWHSKAQTGGALVPLEFQHGV